MKLIFATLIAISFGATLTVYHAPQERSDSDGTLPVEKPALEAPPLLGSLPGSDLGIPNSDSTPPASASDHALDLALPAVGAGANAILDETKRYEELNEQSIAIAIEHRNLAAQGQQPKDGREELELIVGATFEAQQNMLRQELATFEARMQELRATLEARAQQKAVIVQRRVDELMNSGKSIHSLAHQVNLTCTTCHDVTHDFPHAASNQLPRLSPYDDPSALSSTKIGNSVARGQDALNLKSEAGSLETNSTNAISPIATPADVQVELEYLKEQLKDQFGLRKAWQATVANNKNILETRVEYEERIAITEQKIKEIRQRMQQLERTTNSLSLTKFGSSAAQGQDPMDLQLETSSLPTNSPNATSPIATPADVQVELEYLKDRLKEQFGLREAWQSTAANNKNSPESRAQSEEAIAITEQKIKEIRQRMQQLEQTTTSRGVNPADAKASVNVSSGLSIPVQGVSNLLSAAETVEFEHAKKRYAELLEEHEVQNLLHQRQSTQYSSDHPSLQAAAADLAESKEELAQARAKLEMFEKKLKEIEAKRGGEPEAQRSTESHLNSNEQVPSPETDSPSSQLQIAKSYTSFGQSEVTLLKTPEEFANGFSRIQARIESSNRNLEHESDPTVRTVSEKNLRWLNQSMELIRFEYATQMKLLESAHEFRKGVLDRAAKNYQRMQELHKQGMTNATELTRSEGELMEAEEKINAIEPLLALYKKVGEDFEKSIAEPNTSTNLGESDAGASGTENLLDGPQEDALKPKDESDQQLPK
jgi:hypothetical protein